MKLRYKVWGWSAVFRPDECEVSDDAVLRQVAGFVDEEDLFATDYLGGTAQEDALAGALERSGLLRFEFHEGEAMLRVLTEYVARRPLTDDEVCTLCEYTMGQWSDGMGECVFIPSGPFEDYHLQPLSRHEIGVTPYPFVEVAE